VKKILGNGALGGGIVGAVGAALLVVACGGNATKGPETPQAGDAGGAPAQGSGGSSNGGSSVPDMHADIDAAAKPAYDRGWRAWVAGDLAGAATAFQEAASQDPRSGAPDYSLGVVKERLGDPSGAQQAYRSAFTARPDYDVAIAAYAESLAAQGHAGEADTFLTDKHAKYPRSPRITSALADVKSIEKDSGSAQQLAQDSLRLDPNFTPAMVVIARDNYRTRRMELARYALQAILDGFGDASPARDKDNAEAHLLRGLIERESGQRARALDDFSAAYARRPDLVEAAIQLGVMRLEAGNSTDALPVLESATRYAPRSALAHLNLGDCYRLAARPADAKREFASALSLDSSLAAVHYDLGLLYLFSPSIPGTTPDDQVATAIKELDTYRTMRSGKTSATDDADDLYNRAKAKQAEMKQGAAAAAGAKAPSAGAVPAASAGAKPGAAPAAGAPAKPGGGK
jgi:tetratricopeptide (TPR) repeat protein